MTKTFNDWRDLLVAQGYDDAEAETLAARRVQDQAEREQLQLRAVREQRMADTVAARLLRRARETARNGG